MCEQLIFFKYVNFFVHSQSNIDLQLHPLRICATDCSIGQRVLNCTPLKPRTLRFTRSYIRPTQDEFNYQCQVRSPQRISHWFENNCDVVLWTIYWLLPLRLFAHHIQIQLFSLSDRTALLPTRRARLKQVSGLTPLKPGVGGLKGD